MTEVRRYKRRHWAIYVRGELLAVTVYRKGALAIKRHLDELSKA